MAAHLPCVLLTAATLPSLADPSLPHPSLPQSLTAHAEHRDSKHAAGTGPLTGLCYDGSPPVNCIIDPCLNYDCGAGYVCRSDYCGGCYAVCWKRINRCAVQGARAEAYRLTA